ncbi:polyketide synthase [Legionella beliardensis]|uniref:Polyketide synthase n=2 Tax=Legionella beliardensis TaxID=91822 RepID=A0A378I0M8_9GAMM|nr:polyketide synthase [Legionella beliardensis]
MEKNFSDLQKMSPAELLQEIQKRKTNKVNELVTDNEFEQFLIDLWQSYFPDSHFDTHTDFFSLGGTSLQAVMFLSKIKSKYNIEFDLIDMFKATTIAAQAKLIKDTLDNHKEEGKSFDYQADINLIKQINLSSDIKPVSNKLDNILLTGASGFLGIHLLKELLTNTDAVIFCIMRATSKEEGLARLLKIAKANKITLTTAEQCRIQCLCGDIAQKNLGLSEPDLTYVTECCDLIIHSAAAVNFVYPYERLRETNVLSLIELIKIAATYKLKSIHLISTIGVFNNQFNSLNKINENTPLLESAHLNGYFQSKWVIEKISEIAKEKGLPIAIYRPSGITINSKTKALGSEDLTYQLMKLSMKMGAFADLNTIIDVVPVDYVAEAITKLVANHPFQSNIYHLTSGEALSSKELINQLPKSKFIKILSYKEYIEQANKLVANTEDKELQRLGTLLISHLVVNSNATDNLPTFNSTFTDSLLNLKKKPKLKDTLLLIMKAAS